MVIKPSHDEPKLLSDNYHEYVVPRSIPITVPTLSFSSLSSASITLDDANSMARLKDMNFIIETYKQNNIVLKQDIIVNIIG